MNPTKAKGYLGQVNGLYYKIGRFEKLFYWDSTEWCLSNRAEQEIKFKINYQGEE